MSDMNAAEIDEAMRGIQEATADAMAAYTMDINEALADAKPLHVGVLVVWQGTSYTCKPDPQVPYRSIRVTRIAP